MCVAAFTFLGCTTNQPAFPQAATVTPLYSFKSGNIDKQRASVSASAFGTTGTLTFYNPDRDETAQIFIVGPDELSIGGVIYPFDYWSTFTADSGSATASTPADSFAIVGGGIAGTSITGDILTITGTEADTLQSVTDRGNVTTNVVTTGALTISSGGADITGDVDVTGDVDATNVTASATVTGLFGTFPVLWAGAVTSNLAPFNDNTNDLGTVTEEWKDLWIDGTANIDSLVADTADINGGTIDGVAINSSTIGATSASTGAFTNLTSTGTFSATGSTLTLGNNAIVDTLTVNASSFFTAPVYVGDKGVAPLTVTDSMEFGDNAVIDTATFYASVGFPNATTTGRFTIGGDVELYRSAANVLRIPDQLYPDTFSVNTATIDSGYLASMQTTSIGDDYLTLRNSLGNQTMAFANSAGNDGIMAVKDNGGTTRIAFQAGAASYFNQATPKLLIGSGTDNSEANLEISGSAAQKIALYTDTTTQMLMYSAASSSGARPMLVGRKARGTNASKSIVADGDNSLDLLAQGWDGDEWLSLSSIRTEVDGTPGNNDMPGAIVFLTTPDGGSSIAERLRIKPSGELLFAELSAAPGNPPTNTAAQLYMKADKLVVSFYNGTTRKYWYLDLTSTSGGWTYTTTAP